MNHKLTQEKISEIEQSLQKLKNEAAQKLQEIDSAILTNLLAFCIVPNVTFIFIAFTLLRKQTNHNSTDQTCNSNNGFHHGPGFQSRFLINLKKGTDFPFRSPEAPSGQFRRQ